MSEWTDFYAQQVSEDRNEALRRVRVGIDQDNPEDVGRAMDLGKASGDDPRIIYGDLENYDKAYQSRLAGNLVARNQHIQNYVNSDYLAAKVSKRDYGTFDQISDVFQKHKGVWDSFVEGYHNSFGDPERFLGYEDPEKMTGGLAGLRDRLNANPLTQNFLVKSGILVNAYAFVGAEKTGMAVLNGLVDAWGSMVGASPAERDDIEKAAAYYGPIALGLLGTRIKTQGLHPTTVREINMFTREVKKLTPYVRDGVEAPPGLTPLMDYLKGNQAKADYDHLKAVENLVDSTDTAQFSKDHMAAFLNQTMAGRQISIPAERVREFYGDKAPEPGDGKLGDWVTPEQLDAAVKLQGDVRLPLTDWFVKVSKPVRDELREDVRFRENAQTLNESREPARPIPPSLTLEDALKQGIVPNVISESRGPQLELSPATEGSYVGMAAGGLHSFDLLDEAGNAVGKVDIAIKGKTVTIDNIEALAGARGYGFSAVMGLIRQLQERFPGITKIDGVRAIDSGGKVGKDRGVSINLKTMTSEDIDKAIHPEGWGDAETTPEGARVTVVPGTRYALTEPTELFPREKAIVDAIAKEFKRLGIKTDVTPALAIHKPGRTVGGVHFSYARANEVRNFRNLIVYALNDFHTTFQVARHEALHELMTWLEPHERETLFQLARDEGWIKKHNIDQRYEGLPEEKQLEEAIAEEWSKRGVYQSPVKAIFDKLWRYVEAIKRGVKNYFGKEMSGEDLLAMMESGEIGARAKFEPQLEFPEKAEPAAMQAMESVEKEPELPGLTRMEDRELYKNGLAMGINKARMESWLKLNAKFREEEVDRLKHKVASDERQRQTKEWKENRAAMRDKVKTDLAERPYILMDDFFSRGMIQGQRMKFKPKMSPEGLTDEQKTILKDYLSPDGMAAQDIAPHFGFHDVGGMLERYSAFVQERKNAKMEPGKFREALIDMETDNRMRMKYGDLAENITRGIADRIFSPSLLDLIGEDTLFYAEKAGEQLPIDLEKIKQEMYDAIDNTKVGELNSKSVVYRAGKAGQDAEDALKAGKPKEAFQFAITRQRLALAAKRVVMIEHTKEALDGIAERMRKRDDKRTDPAFLDWIHDILVRFGYPVNRTVQDLAAELQKDGRGASLKDFVENVQGKYDMRVPDFLYDRKFRDVKDLTAIELRDLELALNDLVTAGRRERSSILLGQREELAAVKDAMVDSLSIFGPLDYDGERGRWLGPLPPLPAGFASATMAFHVQIEALLNRWSKGNVNGPWNKLILNLISAMNEKRLVQRTFARWLNDINAKDKATGVDLKQKVENNLFQDPMSWDPQTRTSGAMIRMTRRHLRAVMLNTGNQSNLFKLASGYNINHPQMILDWVNRNATQADWDWVHSIGEMFADMKKRTDKMQEDLLGRASEGLPLKKGEWYYPLIAHAIARAEAGVDVRGIKALFEPVYVRATTNQGYLKARTGAIYPLSLELDQLTVQLNQMIHDITMRPAVIEFGKIAYDNRILNAITRHYGKEYAELLQPYIRDVANVSNYRSDVDYTMAKVFDFARENLVSTLVGWNPATITKHGLTAAVQSIREVGLKEFTEEFFNLLKRDETTGERMWSFAHRKSAEVSGRHQSIYETLSGADRTLMRMTGTGGHFMALRDTMLMINSAPIAIFDLLSAVPTWLAEYKKQMRLNPTEEGTAILLADRAVRRAHGSTAITSRPAAMRGGAIARWFSSIYGFYSHIMNRQFEAMWQAKDDWTEGKFRLDKEFHRDAYMRLSANLFAYSLAPIAIELLSDWLYVPEPPPGKEDPLAKKAAIAALKFHAGSWIVLRDAVQGATMGGDSTFGLATTGVKTLQDVLRDVAFKQHPMSREHAGNLIAHGASAFGLMTGLGNAQIGHTAKFLFNYYNGQDHPRGAMEWIHGLKSGVSRRKRK